MRYTKIFVENMTFSTSTLLIGPCARASLSKFVSKPHPRSHEKSNPSSSSLSPSSLSSSSEFPSKSQPSMSNATSPSSMHCSVGDSISAASNSGSMDSRSSCSISELLSPDPGASFNGEYPRSEFLFPPKSTVTEQNFYNFLTYLIQFYVRKK